MRWISLVLGLFCVLPAAAQEAGTKMPPYPDFWGLDLPVAEHRASGRCGKPSGLLFLLPDGEIRLAFGFREDTKDVESCQDGYRRSFFADFFAQKVWEVSEDELNKFVQEHHPPRLTESFGLGSSMKLPSGDIVRTSNDDEFGESCRDRDLYIQYRLELLGADGKLKRTILPFAAWDVAEWRRYPKESTIGEPCEQADESERMNLNVQNALIYHGIVLGDGSLLVTSDDLAAIFRLTPNLDVKFKSKHKSMWVDTDFIKAMESDETLSAKPREMRYHDYLYDLLNGRASMPKGYQLPTSLEGK